MLERRPEVPFGEVTTEQPHQLSVGGVGPVLSTDIVVPEHALELRFHSHVLSTRA